MSTRHVSTSTCLRAAALIAALALVRAPGSAGAVDEILYLDQGWTAAERHAYYVTGQGSQIIPFAWFRALERADSEEGFYADGLARHGYLGNPASRVDLPVGFTVARSGRGRWLGITCAACHTGQVEFRGSTVRIPGAPTQADIHGFLVDLRDAVAATVASREGEKFQRFAARRLRDPSPTQADRLFVKVEEFLQSWADFIEAGTPPVPWGSARVDAFGMTFNRLAAIGLGLRENNRVPDAPVSYPQLWGASWHDRAQWTGNVEHRSDIDRLARNVGEVLGVFGHARLRPPRAGRGFYRTSVDKDNLVVLEELVKKLRAPAWPEGILGPVDRALADEGAALYGQYCAACHPVVPSSSSGVAVAVTLTPVADVGTDPLAAANLCGRTVATGRLEGAVLNALVGTTPLPTTMSAADFLNHVVAGSIFAPGSPPATPARAGGKLPALRSPTPFAPPDCGPDSELMRYKARPLEGIWATGPYLHNGSVPNLYELLLPAARRSRRFFVGSREFDPERVGFVARRGPDRDLFDTTLPGNSNAGHEYGTDALTERQRQALIEYLKTL